MFSLSTCWFADQAVSGDAIVDTALEMGFPALELGYALRADAAESILKRVAKGDVAVTSVHAFSPAPADKPGHPELYSPSAEKEEDRALAAARIVETLELAKRAGAGAVVLHAGRINGAARRWLWVHARIIADSTEGFWYRRNFRKMNEARAKGIAAALESLRRTLAEVLPAFEEAKVRLAIENLPSFDAIPLPDEADALARDFAGSPSFALWYDMGHGQVMENAGYGNGLDYAKRHLPHLAGIHIHDVVGPAGDHQAPGLGGIDFKAFRFLATLPALVFEPACGVLKDDLVAGRKLVEGLWK